MHTATIMVDGEAVEVKINRPHPIRTDMVEIEALDGVERWPSWTHGGYIYSARTFVFRDSLTEIKTNSPA